MPPDPIEEIMSDHVAPTGQKSGTWLEISKDSDRVVQTDTISCVHCGRVWAWQPGSGRRRGFCMRCNGFTCGDSLCDKCVPVEQLLENIEQGRPLDYRPIIVGVDAEPPRG